MPVPRRPVTVTVPLAASGQDVFVDTAEPDSVVGAEIVTVVSLVHVLETLCTVTV